MPFRNSLVGNLNANLASKQQKKDLLKDLLGKKKGGDEGGGSDDKSSGASADGGVSEPLGASKSPSRHHHRSSKKSSNSTHSSTAPNHHRHHHHSGGITPLHLGGPPSTASIWRSYRNMTSYTLTLLPHSCSIHLSPHTGITRANIEPYFVAFLEDMRRETKQKSEILKGTTENGGCKWEKQVIFKVSCSIVGGNQLYKLVATNYKRKKALDSHFRSNPISNVKPPFFLTLIPQTKGLNVV